MSKLPAPPDPPAGSKIGLKKVSVDIKSSVNPETQVNKPGEVKKKSSNQKDTHPAKTGMPPVHVYPTLKDSYPGQTWKPPDHVDPKPQKQNPVLTMATVVPNPGDCPHCMIGFKQYHFTFIGIFLGVLLFPFGLLCCFMTRNLICSHCGARFKT